MAEIQPDPGVIGGVPQAPLVFLPDPAAVFDTRARRFAFLAESSRLAAYLRFLGELSALQARLVGELPSVAAVTPARVAMARAAGMPPIDRAGMIDDPGMIAVLARLCEAARALDMPDSARLALEAVIAADDEDRRWLLGNVLSDAIPDDAAAPHLFVAAAVQVHMARLAATLDAGGVVKVGTGVCPCCGGRPATSSVIGRGVIEGVRYATCATCATLWNEVRVTCLCCGSNAAISYRSVETDKATVKAEVCRDCDSWVKILYQVQNASLDPIADDVGSLGLDLMMKDTQFRRGGFNAFLVGY